MNNPTEKSQPQTVPGAPIRVKKSRCVHTKSTSNVAALMGRMWKIGYKQNVS